MTYEAKIAYGIPGGPHVACYCLYCTRTWSNLMDELDPDGWTKRLNVGGFTVCVSCGCKRCPKATYHDHECSGSNESGQPGSVYGDFELPPIVDIDED